jgi:hypothetical protein
MRLEPQARPVAYEPESIPPPPRDSLLTKVNRRRGTLLTVVVSIAAMTSFGSVVWWAHNQDVRAGGRGLEPLVVQAPTTPTRVKPENAGGLVPPDQDKEVYNRIAPGAVPVQPEKLLPGATTPKLPPGGMPLPTEPKEAEAAKPPNPPTGGNAAPPAPPVQPATPAVPAPPANAPTVTQAPTSTPPASEGGTTIASLIEGMSGSTGGWRIQLASAKSEEVARTTWAKLQAAHGDVLGNLRMQPTRVDLGERGIWYRVQAGPLDEKQAQSICGALKGRKTDCVAVAPAR